MRSVCHQHFVGYTTKWTLWIRYRRSGFCERWRIS